VGVFSRVVSNHKTQIIAFYEPKKFYTVLRRPPAAYKKLKNGVFLQKSQKRVKNLIFCLDSTFVKKCKNFLKLIFATLSKLKFKVFLFFFHLKPSGKYFNYINFLSENLSHYSKKFPRSWDDLFFAFNHFLGVGTMKTSFFLLNRMKIN